MPNWTIPGEISRCSPVCRKNSSSRFLPCREKAKEDLQSEWRGDAEKSIKQQLIIGQLIDDEKIEVSDDDYEKEIAEQAERTEMGLEATKEYIKNNQMEEYLRSDLRNKKLFDKLIEYSTVQKGKKQSYIDVMNKNN